MRTASAARAELATVASRLTASCVLIGLVALVAPAAAHGAGASVRVDDAWARRAPMIVTSDPKGFTGNGAAYAKLVNSGKQADTLIAASSDVAGTVEIHETYQESGLMKMREVGRIDVGPGQTVELKPGSYHLMFINLKRDLKAGESFDLTLKFRNAGSIPVRAVVK